MEITKLMAYVDSTEDPLIQSVRMPQKQQQFSNGLDARSLKRELQEGTRQIKDSIAEKTKERWGEKDACTIST
jgi:hypothetical protein